MSAAPALDPASAISILVGTVLPLLTAKVVRAHWPKWAKGATLAAFSVLAGVGSQIAADLTGHTPFVWWRVVLTCALTYVVGHTTYASVLRDSLWQQSLLGAPKPASPKYLARHQAQALDYSRTAAATADGARLG